MNNMNASFILKAIDKMTGPVKKITAGLNASFARIGQGVARMARNVKSSFGNVHAQFKKFGGSVGRLGSETGKLGLKMTAVAGAVTFAFKRMFIDTASQFEKFQTILITTEGSKGAAQSAMDWISDFATTTPFELDKVTAAYVKLRTFGLNPTQGLLATLGDTSAAMGKDVIQAVEAIADAVTGENERLKEFGVKAKVDGNTTSFEYTDKAGIQQSLKVNKNDRKAIEEALTQIFNEKFAGSMNRLSKTWQGMVSNIADQWTRFKNMVMKNGVFDWLKDKVAGFLEQLNKLAASGRLEEIAKTLGTTLTEGFEKFYNVMKNDVWPMMKSIGRGLMWLKNLFGSWKPLIAAAAAVLAGPLLLAIVGVTTAFAGLATVLWANPLVLAITAAVAAIAGAVYLIYSNWASVVTFFGGIWAGIKAIFEAGRKLVSTAFEFSPLGMLIKNWTPVTEFFSGMWKGIKSTFTIGFDWIKTIFNHSPIGLMIKGFDKLQSLFSSYTQPSMGSTNQVNTLINDAAVPDNRTYRQRARDDMQQAFERQQSNSKLHIEVSDTRVQVKSIESDMDVSVDTGMVMP